LEADSLQRRQYPKKNLHNPCPPDHSPVSPIESLLCVGEIVQFLGGSRSTVYRYIQKGMPCYKMGRKYSFRKEDINEWLSHHKRMSFLVDKILKKALTSPSKIHIDNGEGGHTMARFSRSR
jgi:excisionase family DNA binding protein